MDLTRGAAAGAIGGVAGVARRTLGAIAATRGGHASIGIVTGTANRVTDLMIGVGIANANTSCGN